VKVRMGETAYEDHSYQADQFAIIQATQPGANVIKLFLSVIYGFSY
jgi:hypothetical protein